MDLVEYLESKSVHLKPAPGGNVHTHCWFHEEDESKPGRLYIQVDPESENYGLYYCHVCEAKGGLNSIRHHFGDSPIGDAPTNGNMMRIAADYYAARLMENIDAYTYLQEERGLTHEKILEMKLGWADGGLLTHLLAEGFELEEIQSVGLVNHMGDDFLRNKITIPYLEYGQPVTIRGKQIGGKYLSLPGSTSRLYGHDSVRGQETVLIAAGEFDTAVLQSLGFSACGAPGENQWKSEWTELLVDAKRIYIMFDSDTPGKAGAEKLATTLGPRARVVELPDPPPGMKKCDVSYLYVQKNYTKEDFDFLISKAKGGLLASPAQAYDRWLEFEGNPDLQGLRFNIGPIDREMKHGLLPGQVVTLLARTNVGKSHAKWLRVATPSGFRRWGDLRVGDEVFGSDGSPTKVIGVYDRGTLPSYRIHFSDGTSSQCGLDHIWTVYRRYGKKCEWTPFNLTTEELMQEKLKNEPTANRRGEYRFILPMIEPVQYPEQELPVGPYTLGALIANGTLGGGTARLTTPDHEVIVRVKEEGYDPSQYRVDGCPSYGIRGIIGHIKEMGLNIKSAQKFIPYQYLIGSVDQRIALLQGLMDGDGSNVSKNPKTTNRVSLAYHTTSPQLAKDVVQLVNSLGGTGKVGSTPRQREDGSDYEDIRISIMLPESVRDLLFTGRKDSGFKYTNRHVPRRAIVSIEYEGEEEQQCIAVDAPDHLYAITENYILTHNTLFSLNILHRMRMAKPDIKILFLSLEQMRNEWFERAHRIHSFYDPGVTTLDTVNYWKDNLYLVDENRISEEVLEMCIDQYVYETGSKPDLVLVDYLGYYARAFQGEEYARTTAAIMGLKAIAKRNQLVFLVPHQANRSNDMGSEVRLDQGRGAGTVEETSDVSLALWNPDQRKSEQEGLTTKADQKKELILKMSKSRDGGVNTMCVLQSAPLTLAIVPQGDEHYARAVRERQYWVAGMSYKDAIRAYITGNEDIHIGIDGRILQEA
jgi:hypothetical protein